MLIVISPAKTLDFETRIKTRKFTLPEFTADAEILSGIMRKKKPHQLRKMMGISDALAELNHDRFQTWQTEHDDDNSRQAVLSFMGDVYTGLDATSLSSRDLEFAQKHLRILSGLYGLLRPLDRMQPYRLEMGTALKNPRGKDLYAFWGDQPTASLNAQAAQLRTRFLINLASNEYFRAIDKAELEPEIITPIFKDRKGDKYKVLSFFAKKARGMMARHVIKNRIRRPDGMRDFAEEGYRFNEEMSSDSEYVFTREQQ